jgi:tetratricopeptide (TPR) repeat protein
MKKYIYLLQTIIFSAIVSSCGLVDPGEIVNPNVGEDDFLHSANAMQTWVNGTEKEFAVSIGEFCQLMEILSDNYYNNYSRSSNVFDMPQLLATDGDVKRLQRYIGNMRESADYGFNTVAKYDKNFTKQEKFTLCYIKAYSFILAGEHFTGLPVEDGGDVEPWQKHLKLAAETLDEAMNYAENNEDKAFIHTLKARTYYRLGNKTEAVKEAKEALKADEMLCRQVTFDGENDVANAAQEAIWGTWFQPLPRLDFLDPKYFQVKSTDQCPINIAKAEENYLIIAEASLAEGKISDAQGYMKSLLGLIKKRPVKTDLDDHLEGRFNGGSKHYPMGTDYSVAADKESPFREGLILDRTMPNLISVPYISGTSVTEEMIDNSSDVVSLLQLVYLMRQEVFFAEGRRVADLGMRLPLADVEAAHAPNADPYVQAVIPDFIPTEGKMDAFTVDEEKKQVTILFDMNKIIVENRHSAFVVPFF